MKQDAQFPTRRSVRLKGFDYSHPSAYFLTICTHNKRRIFGEVVGHEVALSMHGKIVSQCWQDIPIHFPNVELASHVVMPNHVHGVIIVRRRAVTNGADGASDEAGAPMLRKIGALGAGSIPAIIRSFKSFTTRRIRQAPANWQGNIWQRGYYEHIIRDEDEFRRTCEYIRLNPANWASDEENPASAPKATTSERVL